MLCQILDFASEVNPELNTTFPLASTVRTSPKPADSKQRLRSAMPAFCGVTPLRNAT